MLYGKQSEIAILFRGIFIYLLEDIEKSFGRHPTQKPEGKSLPSG